MTLMAGPIDTRVNPTKVNELAVNQPIDWFERNLIFDVPFPYQGAQRRVYPGCPASAPVRQIKRVEERRISGSS